MSGQIQAMLLTVPSPMPFIAGGKLHAIATSGRTRNPALADPADHRGGRREGVRECAVVRFPRSRRRAGFAAQLQGDIEKWARIIAPLGINVD